MNDMDVKKLWCPIGLLFTALLLVSNAALAADKERNLAVNRVNNAVSEQRIALVIGNSAYISSPLKNPVNDAKDVAKKLRGLGFDVIERNNLHTRQIGSTLREFRSKLVPGAVALVFYAGHGLQIKGDNYLPAVDADINSEEDVPNQSLAVKQIMDVLDEAKTRLNLVFLDACRNNPYARSFRSADKGLARVSAPSGTLISYATRPGSVAVDGSGRNGLYTSKLLAQMDSNQQIEQALKRVVTAVKAASQGRQEPWMEGSIEGDFCFAGCNAGVPIQGATAQPAVIDPAVLELDAWNTAKEMNTEDAYQAYLTDHADGRHAKFAQAAINKLKAVQQPAQIAMHTPSTMQSEVEAGMKPGKVFRDCTNCPELVILSAGSFDMGSNSGKEASAHRVTIGQPFAMGKTEVTQGQWKAVMGSNPSHFSSCGDSCPVEKVSWNDAQEFIRKLNAKTGKQYRLPSEAEWEYACRAGGQQEYCGSNDVGSVAWYGAYVTPVGNSAETTNPVATKQANAWGLYDMSGNVWEWVEDSYHADYNGAPNDGSVWSGDGAKRVFRGGSWSDYPNSARSANRYGSTPGKRISVIGFRLARMLPSEAVQPEKPTENPLQSGTFGGNVPVMVRIPGKNYEMGKYEVTQGEWQAVMGNNPSNFSSCGDTCPVEKVSWNDAQEFIQKLNARTGKQYRLPTEAEWVDACYGGSRTEYCGGNNIDSVAWYESNSGNTTHPAGQKQANGYGLYDMSGNVWEWTSDCWEGDCAQRVASGGYWGATSHITLVAGRSSRGEAVLRSSGIGFRLARTLPSEAAQPEKPTENPFQSGTFGGNVPVMVRIPGKNYEMGKFHVTRGEFAKFVSETGYDAGDKCWTGEGGKLEERSSRNWRNPGFNQNDTHPVACVNWNDAQAYVSWLARKTGKQYHLPTEAEWEYACYGGSQSEYCGGSDPGSVAWYKDNSGFSTHPVGQKQANGYGLYDMSGNLWQWMGNCYDSSCGRRALRGGSFASYAINLRSVDRSDLGDSPAGRYYNAGFRVARTLP